MLDREYNDSVLLESLVEDIREFTDGMEVSEGKGEYSIRKVRARNNSVSIVLKDRKGKRRSFRVGFERPIQDSLGPVREYIKSAAAKGAGNLSPTPCY